MSGACPRAKEEGGVGGMKRKDLVCKCGCGRPLPPLAVKHCDEWATTECARAFFGVPSLMDSGRSEPARGESSAVEAAAGGRRRRAWGPATFLPVFSSASACA